MNEVLTETFTALMDLSRSNAVDLATRKFPDKRKEKKWKKAIDYLNSLSENIENNIEEVSEEQIKPLQRLLCDFFKSTARDIEPIVRNKKNLSRIFCCIPRLMFNGKSFDSEENQKLFLSFFSKLDKMLYPVFAVPFMKFYLNKADNDFFTEMVTTVFTNLQKNESAYISDLYLYTNRDYLISKSKSNTEEFFFDAIRKCGVKDIYLDCNYFLGFFFDWSVSQNKYTENFFKANKDLVKDLTDDKKKVLLAKTVCGANESDRDTVYENISKIEPLIIDTAGKDKTEMSFWKLSDTELDTKFRTELDKAHRIILSVFARNLMTKFFDILGGMDFEYRLRAEVWRPYCLSKAFRDIRIVLTSSQKNIFSRKLTTEERIIFGHHYILNRSDSEKEPPAIILFFSRKIVIEFIQPNNAAQILASDDDSIHYIMKRQSVYDAGELKKYKRDYPSAYNTADGNGRLIHNGIWSFYISEHLKKYGIYPDIERE